MVFRQCEFIGMSVEEHELVDAPHEVEIPLPGDVARLDDGDTHGRHGASATALLPDRADDGLLIFLTILPTRES